MNTACAGNPESASSVEFSPQDMGRQEVAGGKPGSERNTAPRVLVADDQPDVILALRLLLKGAGFQTESANSPQGILSALERQNFDAILMDLNYTRDTTSGQEGLDLLAQLRGLDDAPPVIVMTAWGSIELAVEAMRRGARDFVLKPWDNTRLLATIRTHVPGSGERPHRRNHGESGVRDMQIARQVQGKLLPQKVPNLSTLEYSGNCRQAGAVGGDYYDFLELAPGRLALVLGDVSGKGIPAALLMANLQATLRSSCSLALESVPGLLETVNQLFFDATSPEHFATLFFADYDDRARQLRYANCGHNPPLLLRKDGRVERLEATATVLGVFRDFSCEVRETDLGPGDLLVMFSDGAVEAPDEREVLFGELRLIELLRKHRDGPLGELAPAITKAILEYSGEEQEDDITFVVARGR